MNAKLILTSILISAILSPSLKGQINTTCYGEKKDFEVLMKRPLVVELLEEDREEIKKLGGSSERIRGYRRHINSYNDLIKTTVAKYWKLNAIIEYKSSSEVKRIREGTKSEFALLGYLEVGDKAMMQPKSSITIPSLCYTRLERPENRPDYKIYLPSSFLRTDGYVEADFRFALECIQQAIRYCIEKNKTINFPDYAEEMADRNCHALKKYDLVVSKSSVYEGMSTNDAQKAYGQQIEWASDTELNSYVIKNVSGKAAMFVLPFQIIKAGSSSNGVF